MITVISICSVLMIFFFVEKLGVCYIFSAKNEKRTIAVIYDIHFLGSASVCVKVGLEIASHALLWFLKEKSFDSIAIVFF